MQKTREKVRRLMIKMRRKLGRRNPDIIKIDNFSFEKVLDTVSNVTDKVSNVAGKVVNTTNTIRNVATNVRSELGRVRSIPPTQISTVQPAPLQASFPGFGITINPFYILAGIIVLIAAFIALRKTN